MWNHPGLLLEIWMCPDEHNAGEFLPACYPLGPEGDAARSLNEPGSFCVLVFWAESHFDAMTFYYRLVHGEEYTTTHLQDHQPYPEAWIEAQRRYLAGL
jgi:hypothetical protein